MDDSSNPAVTEPRRPRLLFVDDEESTRRYFAKLFGDEFGIQLATDADQGIALLQREGASLAVLVTDQRMPGDKSGTDLLVVAREQFPCITRVFSTAYADIDSARDAVNRGDIFRFISKPWDIDALRILLRQAYRHHLDQVQTQRLLEERRSAMLAVAAGIAHEMRTPLASVQLGMTGLLNTLPRLLDGYRGAVQAGLVDDPLPQRILRGLDGTATRVRTEVEQATMIINAMLLAVRDTDDLGGDGASCPVRNAVEAAVERFPFRPGQRERVHLEIDRDFDYHGREELLVYIIFNLLRNALYAITARDNTDPGGKPGELHITLPDDSGAPRIVVRDTGTGIPDHVLPHIFDDYYTTRPAGVGNGLGLPFCRRAMQAMGGTIAVDTQVGEYSCFVLSFPEPADAPRSLSENG